MHADKVVRHFLIPSNLQLGESMPVSDSKEDRNMIIEIGGLPIEVETTDPGFARILEARYGDFVSTRAESTFSLRVQLTPPKTSDPDADAEVWLEGGDWKMQRGDFRARWNSAAREGEVFQSANPYAIDSVLRIVHTLMLAPQGGFLLHASSAVRNGKAFLFSGVSEAGKTTMARLAPPDVALLTDEASYVRKLDGQYFAYGTPFAGELWPARQEHFRADRRALPAQKGGRKPHRSGRPGRGGAASAAQHSFLCPPA